MSVGTRVFIVERGPMAVWIDRCLRAQGAETVVAFSEDEEPSPPPAPSPSVWASAPLRCPATGGSTTPRR